MDYSRNSLPEVIGIIIMTLLIGGLVFAIYPGWDVIGNFLQNNMKFNFSENAPAWIQAGSSVVALFLAFYVPIKMEKDRQKRERFMSMDEAKYFIRSKLTMLENRCGDIKSIRDRVSEILPIYRNMSGMAKQLAASNAGRAISPIKEHLKNYKSMPEDFQKFFITLNPDGFDLFLKCDQSKKDFEKVMDLISKDVADARIKDFQNRGGELLQKFEEYYESYNSILREARKAI